MGFKCPFCHKDFGTNKKEWEEHCKKEHLGAADLVIKELKKLAEEDTKS
jgi:uncharacterized C2H2 Zn-finger protein